jgi:4-amino-4-deoxy-L-arabinose transferase-like glycosyltransferase
MSLRRPTPAKLLTLGALLVVAFVFLNVSPKNPPGFYRDESAIAYNAYTISATGKDEFGGRFPLFIKSFGDYKSPLYVYLLAAVFKVTGPSIHAARVLSGVLGLAAVLVIFVLALAISRSGLIATAVTLLAGLSPWLFEISRLVFEVALEPVLIASFLLVLWRASSGRWRLAHSLGLGVLLAAIVYTYQAGRILAPLMAIGLLLFYRRAGWRQLATVGATFVALLIPMAVYWFVHPGALSSRYDSVTWIHGQSPPDLVWLFVRHWVENMNLWNWAFHGDQVGRHHVPGDGSIFLVQIGLAIAGAVIVLARRRRDPWWLFILWGVVLSPAAASLTIGSIMTLRMITLPIFLAVLAIPALQAIGAIERRGLRLAAIGGVSLVLLVEAVTWQVIYSHNGPKRLDWFEAQVQPVVHAALDHGGTVYAYRDNHSTYIATLFDAAAAGRKRGSVVILDPPAKPPPGAVVVGGAGECSTCRVLLTDGYFEAYLTPS